MQKRSERNTKKFSALNFAIVSKKRTVKSGETGFTSTSFDDSVYIIHITCKMPMLYKYLPT